MPEFINLERVFDSELDMYHCGVEDCAAGHFYGPAVRDHFLIHYIRSGKGMFRVGDQIYQLQKGQGFLICPDIVTFYQADRDDPWSYSWVGFNGSKAESYLKSLNLMQANPIFFYDQDYFLEDCIAQMVATSPVIKGYEIQLKGLLYLFLAKLMERKTEEFFLPNDLSKQEVYLKKALEFIGTNYSRKISIAQIANYIVLDRSYLYSLFKEYLHISPQEFLIDFRINKACKLMSNSLLSIGDISRSVGYDDQLHFSKIFKKIKGKAPREFRNGLK